MRTLALLAALLLLAFQARAQALQETAEQVPAQGQPGAEDQGQPGDGDQDQPGAEDQDEPGDEDQDMAVAFTGGEGFARGARGVRRPIRCYCRRQGCPSPSRPSGTCRVNGQVFSFCCERA